MQFNNIYIGEWYAARFKKYYGGVIIERVQVNNKRKIVTYDGESQNVTSRENVIDTDKGELRPRAILMPWAEYAIILEREQAAERFDLAAAELAANSGTENNTLAHTYAKFLSDAIGHPIPILRNYNPTTYRHEAILQLDVPAAKALLERLAAELTDVRP